MTTVYHHDQIVAVKMIWKCKTGNKVWYTANRTLFESLPLDQQISRFAYILQKDPVVSSVYGTTRQDRTQDPTDYVCQDEPTGPLYLNGPVASRVARIWKPSAMSIPLIRDSGVVPIIVDQGAVGSSSGGRVKGTSGSILGYGWLIDSPDRLNESQEYVLVGPTTTHKLKVSLGAGGAVTSWTVVQAGPGWDSQIMNVERLVYGRSLQIAPFGENDDPLLDSGSLNPNQHGSYYSDPDRMPWHAAPPPGPLLNDRTTHGAPLISFSPPTAQPEGGWLLETVTPGMEWFVDHYPPTNPSPVESTGGFDRPLVWLGVRLRMQLWINFKGRENCHRTRCIVEVDRPLVSPFHRLVLGVPETGTWIGQFPYFGLRYGVIHNNGIFSYDVGSGTRVDLTAVAAVPTNGTLVEMRIAAQGTYKDGVSVGVSVIPSGQGAMYCRSTVATANGLCIGLAVRFRDHYDRRGVNEMQMLAVRQAAEGNEASRVDQTQISFSPLQTGFSRYGVSEGHPLYGWAGTINPPRWGPIDSFIITDTQAALESSTAWLAANGHL